MTYIGDLSEFCRKNRIRYSSKHLKKQWLDDLNTCTFAEHKTSDFAVFPYNKEEIIKIVRAVEDTSSLSIYPVSTGLNFGYGSGTPASDDIVLMCLRDFENNIEWIGNRHSREPYGKKLGIVKVSASVTQQQLYDFLQKEGGDFWMDATGAPTNSSIVGNYLERGFGHTEMGNHFKHIVGMEVVLPDGTFVRTGHAGCVNPANVGIHKYGLGPVIDGLFSQSSLGIVTSIYIELMPAKKCVTKFFIQLNSDDDFYEAVDRLQPLKANGTLTSQMHCGNAHKGIQAMTRYPFERTCNKTPLPDDVKDDICTNLQISPWTISGAIYAESSRESRMKVLRLKVALKGVKCKKIILPEYVANALDNIVNKPMFKRFFPKTYNSIRPKLNTIMELIKLKKGIPTNYFVDSVYWRKRNMKNSSINPGKDNVGMIWIAPIAPMTKDNIKLLVETSTKISEHYEFEPAISITLLGDKAADCILSIVFDRDNESEERNALLCYDKLIEKFNDIGFSSYRSSTRAIMNGDLNYSRGLSHMHKLLKKGIDKNNIIATNYI